MNHSEFTLIRRLLSLLRMLSLKALYNGNKPQNLNRLETFSKLGYNTVHKRDPMLPARISYRYDVRKILVFNYL